MRDWGNTRALVTGASSGIGAALAADLLSRGARVAVAARREDRLLKLQRAFPERCLPLTRDVTNPIDRARMINGTLRAFGGLDLLVNNAGLGGYGGFLEGSLEEWRRIFEVNLFSVVELTRLALPSMLAAGQGTILCVASIGALVAHSDKVTPYVSSKHALLGFCRGLVKDLAGSGVAVKAACPHLTDTEFFSTGPGAAEMAGEADKFRRFMDTPEEVARGILDQLDNEGLVIFPTEKPAKAFAKMKDI